MIEKKKLIFSKDYKKVEEFGLINPNRWDEGVEHHEMSERLVRFMADHDYNDYDDAMCIKVGGDGDNGEHMMYLMDAFFEMLDKVKEFEVPADDITLVASEINRILESDIEILPNSPIHDKLKKAVNNLK